MNTKKILTLTVLLFTTLMHGLANEKPLARLIPFTGTDYIRLVVDKTFQENASNTFKVIIRSADGDKLLWEGNIKPSTAINERKHQLAFHIGNLKPDLWAPASPYLYNVTLQQFQNGRLVNQLQERAGFRSFERKGGNLYLNGKPIFLRGIAINPPGRGIPEELERSREFALEYVKYMKSINVNIIRIPDEEAWFDVCDELGMMVFGGNYGGKVGAGERVESFEKASEETDGGFPGDYDSGVSWYQNEKLGTIAHHPSLMVYAMTNETPFRGKRAEQWEKFLSYAYDKLKKWDETRVYIANAGYGYGKAGDIIDIHRYWGWYYSSPFTFLNIRDNKKIIPFPKDNQPITFSETVGNYTGPDGRYNLTPGHKNPSSQLAWTGDASQDLQSKLADEHQSFTIRQATESFRQLRSVNPDLSGIFPFTILFYNWDTVEKFADMNPKPAADQVKISYQPILASWECWTPNVFAGSTINPIIHIINDDDNFQDLENARLEYKVIDKANTIHHSGSLDLPKINYYDTFKKQLEIQLPENTTTGDYKLIAEVVRDEKIVSTNYYNFFIANDQFARKSGTTGNILVYDGQGDTQKALRQLDIPFKETSNFKSLPKDHLLIIGENAADKQVANEATLIKDFISKGGRVLAMRQNATHLPNLNTFLSDSITNDTINIDDPVYPLSPITPRNGYYINPERKDHPVFSGITRRNLRVWSDYTNWNEDKDGLPQLYPVTDGFMLHNTDAVKNTAILGNFSSGLRGIALAEQFIGNGSVILCGLDIAKRVGLDPVATKMLLNLVLYSQSDQHELHPLITEPIIWGEYETEKGLVTDIYSGLLVSSTPRIPEDYPRGIVVTKEGYQLAGGYPNRFNTRPGIQYVANGRRPWGPFVQSFGGQPLPIDRSSTIGIGKFWCTIPADRNSATHLVWNPADEALEIKIKINDLKEVSATIPAGQRMLIETPVNNNTVQVTYTSDRRLVILETSFKKTNL